jgi:hypothetical protein
LGELTPALPRLIVCPLCLQSEHCEDPVTRAVAGTGQDPDNSVDQILKLAKKIGLPDNIPLLPRLRALAKANVLAFNRKF